MDLESPRARRAFAIFGIVWNVPILTIALLSDVPALWKVAYVVYGGFALVFMGAVWRGKDDVPALRRSQIVAFLVAAGLTLLGALLYRS